MYVSVRPSAVLVNEKFLVEGEDLIPVQCVRLRSSACTSVIFQSIPLQDSLLIYTSWGGGKGCFAIPPDARRE